MASTRNYCWKLNIAGIVLFFVPLVMLPLNFMVAFMTASLFFMLSAVFNAISIFSFMKHSKKEKPSVKMRVLLIINIIFVLTSIVLFIALLKFPYYFIFYPDRVLLI